MFNSCGEERAYLVTAYRTAGSKQGLLSSQWYPQSAVPMHIDDGVDDLFGGVAFYKNAQSRNEVCLYEAAVMSNTWGEPMHMLDQVERFASEAGLRRRPEFSDISKIPGSGTA